MTMKFAVILTLLVSLQAVPPQSSAPTSPHARGDTKDQKTPQSNTAPNDQSDSKTSDKLRQQVRPEESKKDVRITEIPSIRLQKDSSDHWNYFLTGILIFIGFLQAWIFFRQATIAERQELQMIDAGKKTDATIAQMKDTAERELRAYIGVSNIRLDLRNLNKPMGVLEIKNFGRTPAMNVRTRIAIGINPYSPDLQLPPFPELKAGSVSSLFPDIPQVSKVELKSSLPERLIIGTMENTIYVYGWTTYNDVFGHEQLAGFRYFFGGPEEAVTFRKDGVLYGAMYPDSVGNVAT